MPAKKKTEYTMGKGKQSESTVGSESGKRSKRQKKRARRERGLQERQR